MSTDKESIVREHVKAVAREQQLPERGVAAVLEMMSEGATVPFIARYRKERTGGLDEVQIRAIAERYAYIEALESRRLAILKSIDEQGLLTAELRRQIVGCDSKVGLEDLYLPYKPKRRTRGTMARERGLQPLADQLLSQRRNGDPFVAAQSFVDPSKEVGDVEAALAGARDIVAEQVAETAAFRTRAREITWQTGTVETKAARGKADERSKFEQYKDFSEPVRSIPSHRLLAILRGEREKMLSMSVGVETDRFAEGILRRMDHAPGSWGRQLEQAVDDSLKRLVMPSVSKEVLAELKTQADVAAVDVFATNLKNLLLAGPLGQRPVVGIDPGLRTGCKCTAVDATGRYLDTITIYPTQNAVRAEAELTAYLKRHRPDAVAVGNGTGGRESLALARQAVKTAGLTDTLVVEVNEAGASVYSASDIARAEYPDLDLTIRGAISIAHRLQDPLAELVKIDPKSIGVGQYQHDVHQPLLQKKLTDVVEDCVNRVGVVLNTASAPLLAHVAGIGPRLSGAIVAHRDKNGPFRKRRDLLKVAGLGPKTFEQAAGFLRIVGGDEPLDASAVHPERYKLVSKMAGDLQTTVSRLVGDEALANRIPIDQYADPSVGIPTLKDIVAELVKPGRDPRQAFEPPAWRDDITTIGDLHESMVLDGVVTNVTNFGAFVDLGVHQDGLVHISELSDRFVRDPSEVVKVGDKLKVRVLEVDVGRKRISLSAKTKPPEGSAAGQARPTARGNSPERPPGSRPQNRPQDRPAQKARTQQGRSQSGARSDRPPNPQPGEGGSLKHNPFADLFKKD